MKKIILSVLICLCGLVFVETGALGFQWGEKLDEKKVKKSSLMQKYEENMKSDDLEIKLRLKEKKILGNSKEIICLYTKTENDYNYYLNSIYFLIPNNKVDEIKNKLHNIFYYSEMPSIIDVGEIAEKTTTDEEKKILFSTAIAGFAFSCEFNDNKNLLENLYIWTCIGERSNFTFSIYDYNDDTRVYIFENMIDETVVVYVPHEKDY